MVRAAPTAQQLLLTFERHRTFDVPADTPLTLTVTHLCEASPLLTQALLAITRYDDLGDTSDLGILDETLSSVRALNHAMAARPDEGASARNGCPTRAPPSLPLRDDTWSVRVWPPNARPSCDAPHGTAWLKARPYDSRRA